MIKLYSNEFSDTLQFHILDRIFDLILLFYAMNLLSWFLLINNLQKYSYLKYGVSFQQLSKDVKRTEKKSVIIVILLYFAYIILLMINDIVLFDCDSKIIRSSAIVISAIMLGAISF